MVRTGAAERCFDCVKQGMRNATSSSFWDNEEAIHKAVTVEAMIRAFPGRCADETDRRTIEKRDEDNLCLDVWRSNKGRRRGARMQEGVRLGPEMRPRIIERRIEPYE
jgi:hypothetical protein